MARQTSVPGQSARVFLCGARGARSAVFRDTAFSPL